MLAGWFAAMTKRLGGQEAEGVSKAPIVFAPKRAVVPAPQIEEATYVSGNKLQIKWSSLGEGFTYRVFRSYRIEDPEFLHLVDEGGTVSTPGAIVNAYKSNNASYLIAVMAIRSSGSGKRTLSTGPVRPQALESGQFSRAARRERSRRATQAVPVGGPARRRKIKTAGATACFCGEAEKDLCS